jgi:hypothetical protein
VSELIEMDYMGLWSHAETAPGTRYLVIAAGASTSPAALMQEGPTKRLFDARLVADVRAAMQAEPGADPSRVLDVAHARIAEVDELFAGYMWARIRPAFLRDPQPLLEPILKLLRAVNATLGFRRSAIDGLDDAVTKSKQPEHLVIPVARAYFALLDQPEAEQLADDLIEVHIFNTVFANERRARVSARQVLPNASDRERYAALIEAADLERGEKIEAWLRAG